MSQEVSCEIKIVQGEECFDTRKVGGGKMKRFGCKVEKINFLNKGVTIMSGAINEILL